MPSLLLDWTVCGNTGWGWYGAHLMRHASLQGWSVQSRAIDWSTLPPEWRLEGWDNRPLTVPVDVAVVGCGNGQAPPRLNRAKVGRAVAAIFVEDTRLPPEMVEALNGYDLTICGSAWNADLLEGAGVERVELVLQGADCYAEHRARAHSGPYRIFSGGKLEYRKGQDLVIAAFRECLRSHPDTVLVTAWQNRWPQTMKGLGAAGHVEGWPSMLQNGLLDIVGWCEKNGIPRGNVIDVGMPPSWALQRVMAQCDVCVAPSRAEGGTNLVATEALAVGLPTLATIATGQQHLLDWGAGPVPFTGVSAAATTGVPYREMGGWVEADPSGLAALMLRPVVGTTRSRPPRWSEAIDRFLGLCAGVPA